MSRVDIWVLGFDPGFPESPSDGLRRVFGLETQEALTLELTVPTPVKRVDPGDVNRWLTALRSIGAEVEERPVGGGTPPAFDLPEPQAEAELTPSEVPPGVVMPTGTAEAKAKAQAEIAALASKQSKGRDEKGKQGSGAVKEEVHRVIRTPSTPQDRRPPPQRKASTPALLLDEEAMAKADDPAKGEPAAPTAEGAAVAFGELDLGAVEAKSQEKELAEARKRSAAGPPELELADVKPRRRPDEESAAMPDLPPTVEGPSKGRDIAIGAGALVVGLVSLYIGLMRYESALLGTGSLATWAVDAVGFGGLLYGVLHLALTFAGREPEPVSGRLLAVLVIGYGIAYGAAALRAPSADTIATLQSGGGETVPIREVLNDPKARLAESTPDEGQAIVDAALEGGAISVDAGHLQGFLGRTVAHVLVIELPETAGARAHMAALLRRALGADRATLAADVPTSEHWAVPLR